MKELRILNRTVKWTGEGITIVADDKHVKTLLEEMGMQNAKPVKTPAIRPEGARNSRDAKDDEDDEAELGENDIKNKDKTVEEEVFLNEQESFRFRSWTARKLFEYRSS